MLDLDVKDGLIREWKKMDKNCTCSSKARGIRLQTSVQSYMGHATYTDRAIRVIRNCE